ncbi:MAG TPA: hypothetical protein PLD10_15960 [Rhodopila sp.]|nr:hypothetical protein [Rhodopila sp.]
MLLQYSTTLRTNQVAQISATVGTGGTVKLYAGAIPANAAAVAGTEIASGPLPNPFMSSANGSTALAGTWTLTGEAAAGTGTVATYFRMLDSGGICHMQGDVGASGSGAALIVTNTNIANGQTESITSFTITAGNP